MHHRLFSASGIAINPEEDATLIQEFVLKAGTLLDNVSRGIFVKTAKERILIIFILYYININSILLAPSRPIDICTDIVDIVGKMMRIVYLLDVQGGRLALIHSHV